MGPWEGPAQGRQVALIACGKRKRPGTHPASFLYVGPVFTKSLMLAKSLGFSHIFILSALHGVIPLDRPVTRYDHTLYTMSRKERSQWGDMVVEQLSQLFPTGIPPITYFAGSLYRESVPLPGKSGFPIGMPLGKLLAWLNIQVQNTRKGTKKCGLLY